MDAVLITRDLVAGSASAREMAEAALAAGRHVWIDRSLVGTLADVRALIAARDRAGTVVQVGMASAFRPAIERMREISRRAEFGRVVSVYATYPVRLPPADRRTDPAALRATLDALWHPAGTLLCLAGEAEYLTFRSAPNGGGIVMLKFLGGAVGVLHMTAGEPAGTPSSMMEWLEVVGAGQSLLLDNNVRLTWYRKPAPPPGGYQRALTFIGEDDGAARYWEPELSRETAANSGHEFSGRAAELRHFARAIRRGERPDRGTLEQCAEILAWLAAFAGPEGERISIPAIRRQATEAVG